MRSLRRWTLLLAGVAFLVVAGLETAGQLLTKPARRVIGSPPGGLPSEQVGFSTSTGEPVAGWLVRGKAGFGAVLLVHSYTSDRREMIERARFLSLLGYTVLLIDLPSHGESAGTRITFGLTEARGVEAALAYLARVLPGERVGVIGVSLGGAAIALARLPYPPSAIVLESVYPTIEEAAANRLKLYLGPFGVVFAPLLMWQLPVRLGISAEQLRPIAGVARLQAPILVISGGSDRHTTRSETQRLFQVAPEPKELWIVEGAAHVDLHQFDPRAYESRVAAFLARHLRRAG
jgi:fermentation-respiration switch protein FrsA (DUF1100 family)